MTKISGIALAAAGMSLAWGATQTFAQSQFKPAEVSSASEIAAPIQSLDDGVVVLDASLDEKGAITGITVVRDIPSLTSPARSSLQSWKFLPASGQRKAEHSIMRVAVVFRPRSYLAAGPTFTPILTGEGANQEHLDFEPPGIVSVTYPQYPINAAVPGTVVVQVTIGKSNVVQRLRIVRDLPPFSQTALSTLNKWRFRAATLDGKPTASNLAVAFVFTPLSSGQF
jgi:hypothetical protein